MTFGKYYLPEDTVHAAGNSQYPGWMRTGRLTVTPGNVIDFGWMRLCGWKAWWVWGLAHVYFLIGARNRLVVATNWLWSYLTFDRGARLITGPVSPPRLPATEADPARAA